MTREELIYICESAIVHVAWWRNRDTPRSQSQIGECWALLKAECNYRILTDGDVKTDERTIWIEIEHPVFGTFDLAGRMEKSTFYLPTKQRLAASSGSDWY
jgi:hypothetical protein